MKKFVLAAVAFVASLGAAQAQDLFSKGESALNIGIGIGHSYGGYGVSIPPLSVALTTVSLTTSSTATTGRSPSVLMVPIPP